MPLPGALHRHRQPCNQQPAQLCRRTCTGELAIHRASTHTASRQQDECRDTHHGQSGKHMSMCKHVGRIHGPHLGCSGLALSGGQAPETRPRGGQNPDSSTSTASKRHTACGCKLMSSSTVPCIPGWNHELGMSTISRPLHRQDVTLAFCTSTVRSTHALHLSTHVIPCYKYALGLCSAWHQLVLPVC